MTSNQGFTLIELLLYSSLTSIVIVVMSAVAINTAFGDTKNQAIEIVNHNAHLSLQNVIRTVKNAESIIVPVVGATSSNLVLTADGSGDQIAFSVSSGTLSVREGTQPAVTISSVAVEVTDITFSNVSYSENTGVVSVVMTVQTAAQLHQNNSRTYEETYSATASIREKP